LLDGDAEAMEYGDKAHMRFGFIEVDRLDLKKTKTKIPFRSEN
jgi:hypothetical protein